jgi:DNA (cytosine-5)-methyltransferase 1
MAGFRETEIPDGTHEQPIVVDKDQDAPQSGIGFEVEKLVRQVRRGDARFDPIDLDGEDDSLSEDPWRADEDNYDNENAKIEREELPNGPEDTRHGPCVHWKKAVRNPCPCGTHQKVPRVTIGNLELGESQVVELKEPVLVGRYGAEFVEIREIWAANKGDHVLIRGRTYARTRNLEGRIEPRKNEVCEIYELDENDHRINNPVRYLEQTLVEVPIQDIKTTRTLHKTNKAFPECHFDQVRYRSKEERENEAPLTCRWQMILSYPDPRYRRQQRPVAGEVIRHYNQDDAPKGRHRIPDSERRKAHEKTRGGSFIPKDAHPVQAGPEASPIHLAPGQKYTVVDIFSGAGGYSKGAEMAGLKILAACDHWPWCCETYRQNFPDTELHQEDVYKFIEDMSTDLTREPLKVDILHFSPPCQTWSPAHTCEGKKDKENRATLFACEKFITIFKPRIFTIEQTFGLAQERWIPNFNALLQGFTRHGYSVRWKVLHLVEYGLPQTRKRLVMIGASPGEQMPEWPKPTHSKDPKDGQKPFVSALDACSALVEGENLHDVKSARPTNKVPWDSSKPLGRTITTSGGQSYHHSGTRDLTLRELAVFQGFPSTFVFMGKCIKKQIGNAFAPVVVKTLLKSIRGHLEKFDGVTRQPPPGQIIVVTDDDDDDDNDNNENGHLSQQLQHKDQSQSQAQVGSWFGADDLVGFGRKPSGPSQDLLRAMIQHCRKNSIQCFIAKDNQNSSEGGRNSGPSLRRSSRVSCIQVPPTQRNTTDAYFVPDDDQGSPRPSKTSATPNPSVTIAEEENNIVHQRITRTHPGITRAPHPQEPSELNESRTGRSTEPAIAIAHLGPTTHFAVSDTRHSTAAPSGGRVLVGGRLDTLAPNLFDSYANNNVVQQTRALRCPSTWETDKPLARESQDCCSSDDSHDSRPAPGPLLELEEALAGALDVPRHSRNNAVSQNTLGAADGGDVLEILSPKRGTSYREGTAPGQAQPPTRSCLAEGLVGSAVRQTGIGAAMRNIPKDTQPGGGAPGPGQPRASGGSDAYMEGSSHTRAKSDEEEEAARLGGQRSCGSDGDIRDGNTDGSDDDHHRDLQHALWSSRADAPSVRTAPYVQGDADLEAAVKWLNRPGDVPKQSPASQTRILRRCRLGGEDSPEIYGPGDSRGKAVTKRALDEGEEERNPEKRRCDGRQSGSGLARWESMMKRAGEGRCNICYSGNREAGKCRHGN